MSTKFQVALQSACDFVESGTSEAEAIHIVCSNHRLSAQQSEAMRHRVEAEMDARRVAAAGQMLPLPNIPGETIKSYQRRLDAYKPKR